MIRLKEEEVTRLSRIRDDVESELQELTASLFQEYLHYYLFINPFWVAWIFGPLGQQNRNLSFDFHIPKLTNYPTIKPIELSFSGKLYLAHEMVLDYFIYKLKTWYGFQLFFFHFE